MSSLWTRPPPPRRKVLRFGICGAVMKKKEKEKKGGEKFK
jgi:hypothetical protein